MTTDAEWEKWGARDPYYGVLTHPRFRRDELTAEARAEFFALGQHHVEHVLRICRAHLDPHFRPQRALDFGCGVGRLVLPFARQCEQVVGVDISPSMLAEARRNCDAEGLGNVDLVLSDDRLSAVMGEFDLVHSCIVLQHIEVERGLRLFAELVARVRPGGFGALHVTFGWDHHAANLGVPPPVVAEPLSWRQRLRRAAAQALGRDKPAEPPVDADPEMQMNFYNMSQLMYLLQRAGVSSVYSELTDHGGALGAFMFFRR